jgi:hypothetical protein
VIKAIADKPRRLRQDAPARPQLHYVLSCLINSIGFWKHEIPLGGWWSTWGASWTSENMTYGLRRERNWQNDRALSRVILV